MYTSAMCKLAQYACCDPGCLVPSPWHADVPWPDPLHFNHVIIILQVRSPTRGCGCQLWLNKLLARVTCADSQSKASGRHANKGPRCVLNLPITIFSILSLFRKKK
jgi:hypothetical protein